MSNNASEVEVGSCFLARPPTICQQQICRKPACSQDPGRGEAGPRPEQKADCRVTTLCLEPSNVGLKIHLIHMLLNVQQAAHPHVSAGTADETANQAATVLQASSHA